MLVCNFTPLLGWSLRLQPMPRKLANSRHNIVPLQAIRLPLQSFSPTPHWPPEFLKKKVTSTAWICSKSGSLAARCCRLQGNDRTSDSWNNEKQIISYEAFKGWFGHCRGKFAIFHETLRQCAAEKTCTVQAVGFGNFYLMMLKIRRTNMKPALLERRSLAPKERSDLFELIGRKS